LYEALTSLQTLKYTLMDARNRRPISSYVFTVSKHARDAGFETPHQRLTYAYHGIHILLRTGIPEPDARTTVEDFVKACEHHREDMAEIAEFYLLRVQRPQLPAPRH
jgi:hypothetical protein